jgi:hypothetical protein
MLIVAALLLLTGEPKVSLVTSKAQTHAATPPAGAVTPGPTSRIVLHQVSAVSAAAPIEWMLLFLAVAALAFAAWLWSRSGRSRPPTAPA